MDIANVLTSDTALLLFSGAGLVATTLAILQDTRSQRSEPATEAVKLER